MRGSSLLAAALAAAMLMGMAGAQYWFQSGAQGDYLTYNNHGASASIETITPQPYSKGSLAYWIGETLSNGAFIQVGYLVANQTGSVADNCTLSGCSGTTYLVAGHAAWFWEYFPAGASDNASFYGNIGPDGSAGANGTFNTYSFNSSGTVWRAYLNGRQVGSVDLGARDSGPNPVLALGEYADAEGIGSPMPNVRFRNLAFYDGTVYRQVPTGYSTIGYGKGSSTTLSNPYGVEEVGSFANFFMVGSGLPVQDSALLWKASYSLTIKSPYPNATGGGNYTPYSTVDIAAPAYANVSNVSREAFGGWVGTGTGSYTGPSRNASVTMYSNITETPTWKRQYLISASTQYGTVSGGGWYDAGSTADISLDTNVITLGFGKRVAFISWSDGHTDPSISLKADGPAALLATWGVQYLVNASTPYGNVIGNGWYYENATADIGLSSPNISTGEGTRIAFVHWSDGSANATIAKRVTEPVFITASYARQAFVRVNATDAYGKQVSLQGYSVNADKADGGFWASAGSTYMVSNAVFKGTVIADSYSVGNVTAPTTASIRLPIYNVTISTRSAVIGLPVNAMIDVTFKNGTAATLSTGDSGMLTLRDVPYGYVYGSTQYLGENYGISASGGGAISINFVTPTFLVMFFGLLAIVMIVEIIYFRRIMHPEARP